MYVNIFIDCLLDISAIIMKNWKEKNSLSDGLLEATLIL